MAVACSGGRDSVALLHATVRVAAVEGWRVVALHVHHGLSPHADAWAGQLAREIEAWRCGGLPVTLDVVRLATKPPRAASIEAWARTERYGALARMARAAGADVVLLAHHRRDQAETLLLQALRGGGVAGLAAMPRRVEREGLVWLRPWLDRPREDIEAWVAAHGLRWVDDESNEDERYARNRLRRSVWPALTAAFPQAESTLADAARWAAEAQQALNELALQDLAAMGVGPGAGRDAGTGTGIDRLTRGPASGPLAWTEKADDVGSLPLAAWTALSAARGSLALRSWLQAVVGVSPPASLVLRLLAELPAARSGRWPAPGGELRLHRGRLQYHAVSGGTSASGEPGAPGAIPLPIRRAGRYKVPAWGGCLRIERVREGGVPLAALAGLELRPRRGGEAFQAGPGRPPRSLKKQFQAAGVPAWQRDGPLMYVDDRLVAVPGLGIDARAVGRGHEAMVRLDWVSDTQAEGGAA